MKILFVCFGNICRSPMAEAVFLHLLKEADLEDRVEVDSAGVSGCNEGCESDTRAQLVARIRGIELNGYARKVRTADFRRFDIILAMDEENHSDLLSLCPEPQRSKIRMMRSFAEPDEPRGVPDPYGAGPAGFEEVYRMIEQNCQALLRFVQARLANGSAGHP